MSIEQFEFTKNWNNPEDFSTYENDEARVRADIQLLHDESKNFINEVLIPYLRDNNVELTVKHPDGVGPKYIRLNADKVLETSEDGVIWQATGSSGHLILDGNGVILPQRSRMKFKNGIVEDDGETTVITALKGDTGPQGAKGDTGETGPVGPQGKIGPVIVPSVDANGVMSFTLQDTAIAPGSVSVRGPQGPQGVQGQQGAQGARGPQGIQGVQGAQGIQGKQGETGPAGPVGPAGPSGPQGERGNDGADGRSFVVQDVFATLGELKSAIPYGDEYAYQVTGEDDEIFIWSEKTGTWVSLGKLQGPAGPAGAQGPVGPVGPTGPQGPQGIQGIQGNEGPVGPQGEQGPAGVSGEDGKSAYQSAAENGYSGTETAFNEAMVAMPGHIEDKNNPHGVTPAKIGAPTVAEMKAAIAAIPTPDVSGQINTHNTNGAAHSDIRTLVSNAQSKANSAASAAATAQNTANALARFQSSLGNEYVWAKMGTVWHAERQKSGTFVRFSGDSYYIGTEIEVSNSGVISIKNPTTTTNGSDTVNKYFAKVSSPNTVMYGTSGTQNIYWDTYYDNVVAVGSEGVESYFNSPNANAYGDGYDYLGRLGDAFGGAKIATGSYTGTGKYGSGNKNKLTFDFVPKFVIIQGSKYYSNITADCLHIGILTQGCTGAFTSEIYAYRSKLDTNDNELFGVTVSWSDNTVTWYAGANYQAQLNESGYTYGWIAIG